MASTRPAASGVQRLRLAPKGGTGAGRAVRAAFLPWLAPLWASLVVCDERERTLGLPKDDTYPPKTRASAHRGASRGREAACSAQAPAETWDVRVLGAVCAPEFCFLGASMTLSDVHGHVHLYCVSLRAVRQLSLGRPDAPL